MAQPQCIVFFKTNHNVLLIIDLGAPQKSSYYYIIYYVSKECD